MSDCVFCKIVRAEIPAATVWDDAEIVAFEDLNPVAPTHVLVIPKKHIATLNDAVDADGNLLGKMLGTARKIASDMDFAADGYRLIMNVMPGAGQAVFHIHLHLLAGRPFGWPPG